MAKMSEIDDYAFVRSHHSNLTNTCFECCVHENCEKRFRLMSKSMKWCLLVNGNEHTNATKLVPTRKNGKAVKGIRGKARGHMQELLKCRCTGAATVENELVN